MYQIGLGVKQDYTEAMKWYRKAAQQGYVHAQFSLGVMYEAGEALGQRDAAEAAKLYRKGVGQDYAEAVKWYRKAAEQGYTLAQYNLGLMYKNGKGVKQNYAEAVKWYRKAAQQGSSVAQDELRSIGETW